MDKLLLFNRSTFFLGIWLCYSSIAFSQHFNFTNYTVEDGLTQSEVSTIIQDSKLDLWLGTNGGGISRFDGQKFISYSEKDGLSNNIVNALCEDKNGNIWIATEDGVSRYNRRKFTRYTTRDGLANNKVFAV